MKMTHLVQQRITVFNCIKIYIKKHKNAAVTSWTKIVCTKNKQKTLVELLGASNSTSPFLAKARRVEVGVRKWKMWHLVDTGTLCFTPFTINKQQHTAPSGAI